jgi:2Fe-2S ferredoxin
MPNITFVHPDGTTETLDAPDGDTVMEVATDAGVEGILGECGGFALCATCHVYATEPVADVFPPIGIAEEGMLEGTASPRHPNSRLSCQLPVTDGLDGAIFEIPPTQ